MCSTCSLGQSCLNSSSRLYCISLGYLKRQAPLLSQHNIWNIKQIALPPDLVDQHQMNQSAKLHKPSHLAP